MRLLNKLLGPPQPNVPLPSPAPVPPPLDPFEKRELRDARRRLEGPGGRLAAVDRLIDDFRRFEDLLER